MKKKTWGIILLVLGIVAFLGALSNGTIASYTNGVGISEITTIALMIGSVAGGLLLIAKDKQEQ